MSKTNAIFNKLTSLNINHIIIDINECEEFGTCDQYCLNSYGTFMCSCNSEYGLIDNHKCKIKGTILKSL